MLRPVVLLAAFPAWLCLAATQARADVSGAFPHLEAWPTTLSLGGIPAALGYGVEAVLENPTGMLRGDGSGIAFSHASLFAGGLVRHQAAALCWLRREELPEWKGGQVHRRQGETRSAWGLGVTNLSGDLPGSDTYGELEIALSYARRVPLGLQSGVRLRMLQARSTVDGSSGGGLAVDVGLEGSLGGWRAGAVARALASSVNWDRSLDGPLPRGFDLGLERGLGSGLRVMAGGDAPSDRLAPPPGRGGRLAAARHAPFAPRRPRLARPRRRADGGVLRRDGGPDRRLLGGLRDADRPAGSRGDPSILAAGHLLVSRAAIAPGRPR